MLKLIVKLVEFIPGTHAEARAELVAAGFIFSAPVLSSTLTFFSHWLSTLEESSFSFSLDLLYTRTSSVD